MEQIIIQGTDKSKMEALLRFLRTLEFIENITSEAIPDPRSKVKNKEADFFALAGLWAGRDITIDTIRQQAWPERT
jgi:hypothetical protein